MEIFGLMSLGLFLGMTHAMDADHIAAVSIFISMNMMANVICICTAI
jgi:high-affinity nickel permease